MERTPFSGLAASGALGARIGAAARLHEGVALSAMSGIFSGDEPEAKESEKTVEKLPSAPVMLGLSDVYPSQESQLSFLRGCVCLAQADGGIADAEKAFFTNAAAGMGLSAELQQKVGEWLNSKLDPNEVIFNSKRQALFFIREALQLCYLDGHFSEKERSCLDGIRQRVGISRASFEYVEDWVKEGLAWRQEGELLLGLED